MRGRLMWVSGAAFLLAVAGGLVFFVRGGPAALETGDKIGSIGSLLFGAASLAVALVTLRSARRTEVDDPAVLLDRAAEELARLVDDQWRREAQRRGLLHPAPMRIPWSSTTRPVSAPVSEIVPPMPGTRPTRLRLHGYIGEVAGMWRRLPAKQLVVIGPPAAGKTSLVVLFVREVLAERTPGDVVPVLLNLAGWDPETTHLDTWLARRLEADYPQLTARRSYGEDAAVRLVDRRRVIPVLDGLDEMPEAVRPLAVAALNQAVAGDRPLVLTCRSDEFEATIAAGGAPLGRAAVVELEPLSGEAVAAYLPAGQVGGSQRWAAVLERLATEPQGVLAAALSNPLMGYLARTAFGAPDTDPGELLAYDTVAGVEEHLFEAYLPTVYRPRLPERDEVPSREYRAEQAREWLTVIASRLQERGSRNFCLWRLGEIRPNPVQSLRAWLRGWRTAVGVGVGLVVLVAAIMAAVAEESVVTAGVLASLAAAFQLWNGAASPGRLRIRPRRVVLGLALLPVFVAVVRELQPTAVVLSGMDRLLGVSAVMIGFAVVGGVVIAGLVDASPGMRVAAPVEALRRDRAAVLTVVLVGVFLTCSLVVMDRRPLEELFAIAALGCAAALGVATMVGIGSAWFHWVVGRTWLASTGLLPWRLLAFVDDAHRRGVLRVVGTEYQFRHARLQDYLSRSR